MTRRWATGREEEYEVICEVTYGAPGTRWTPPEPDTVEIEKVIRCSDDVDVTEDREGYYYVDGPPYEEVYEEAIRNGYY